MSCTPEPFTALERERWSLDRADVEEWAAAHGYVTRRDYTDGLWTVAVVGTDYEILGDTTEYAAWADLATLINHLEANLTGQAGELLGRAEFDAR